MAQIVLSQSGTGNVNMRCRVTYEAGNGAINITKLEGCRTDGYDLGASLTSDANYITVTVTVGGSAQTFGIGTPANYPQFTKNGVYKNWSGFTGKNTSGLNGDTSVVITFGGNATGTNPQSIKNSKFNGTINAGSYTPPTPPAPIPATISEAPSMVIKGLDTSYAMTTYNPESRYQRIRFYYGNDVLISKDIGANQSLSFILTQAEIESIFDKKQLVIRLHSYTDSAYSNLIGTNDKTIAINYEGVLVANITGTMKNCLPYIIDENGIAKLCNAFFIDNNLNEKRSVGQ